MSLADRVIKVIYTADGSNTTFAMPDVPIVSDSNEVKVYLRNESTSPATVTLQTEGALNEYTLTGRPTPSDFHVNVEFNAAPANGVFVVVVMVLPFTQTLDYNGNNSAGIRPTSLEEALDRAVGMIQQLVEVIERSPKLGVTERRAESDLDIPDPTETGVEVWGWDENGKLTTYSPAALLTYAGDGIPAGGDEGAVLRKASAADADAEWGQYDYDGFSSRFGATFTSTDLQDTLDKIIAITYTAPTISLSASGNSLREKGAEVTSSTLTAVITKRSDPIDTVRFYLNPSTLLATQTSGGGIPSGGSSTYAWSGSFSDNTTFRAEVDDTGATGGPSTVSSTTTFSFVYPYYVGAGAVDLTAANVAALTKRIINSTTSRVETITAGAGEVFFFAYPASYGALTSILDVNNFETIGDWTLRTENITGLDESSQSYRIYEFDNPVTAGAYQYTFKR